MSRVSAFELMAGPGPDKQKNGVSAFDILNNVERPSAAPTQFGIDFNQDKTAVRLAIKKLPKDQRDAAMRQWADTFVAKERAAGKGSTSQYVGDVVRNVSRGFPILGAYLDEANALTSSAMGGDYDEALAYQRATDRAVDKESTKIGTLPVIGDVTVGGAQKLAGGLLSGGALLNTGFRGLQLLRGTSILPTLGNLATNAGLAGGFYGFGQGEGAADRSRQAATGLAAGAVLAPAFNLAGRGMAGAGGAIAGGARNAYQRVTGTSPVTALSPYHPGAVSRVQRGAIDDGLTPRQAAVETARLGPQGMLLDMGDNLRGQAGAVANSPGAGQSTVKGALRARNRLALDRLTAGVNREIGPEGGTISMAGGAPQRFGTYEGVIEGAEQGAQQMAAPLYRQFHATRIDYTPRLREVIRRAEALDPRIRDKARDLMRAEGLPLAVRQNNSTLIDYVRRNIDTLGQKAAANEDMNLARIAGNISRNINQEVDDILARRGSTVYADARGTAEQGFRFQEGARDGLSLLGDKTLSAEGVRRRVGNATVAELGGLRIGAREDLRRRMMNAESAFGTAAERGATKGRQILSSTEARGKIGALVGPAPARNLTRLADAESRFADNSNSIIGNSATAGRQAAQKEFPNAVQTVDVANELGKKTATGVAAEAGYRAMNFLLSGRLDEQRIMIAADAARMLVARGADRDQIIRALLTRANRQGVSQQQRQRLGEIASNLMQRALPTALNQDQNGK